MELPESWKIGPKSNLIFQTVQLKGTDYTWLSLAELPQGTDLEKVVNHIRKSYPGNIIIRGCRQQFAKRLEQCQFKKMQIGSEAILSLSVNPFKKSSLNELVQRGKKQGRIEKVFLSDENKYRLARLKKNSRHGQKPQLKYLFRDQIEKDLIGYALVNKENQWLAFISLSKTASGSEQTELLLKHREASVGVMEYLVSEIFYRLKKDGLTHWSLGEVPFILVNKRTVSLKEKMICITGNRLKFAYNNKGLFEFKDKFNPDWQSVYLCGYPRIPLSVVGSMFFKSNLGRIAVHSIKELIRFDKKH